MTDPSVRSVSTVGPERGFLVVVWLGLPILGAVAGALLALLLDWIVGLSWAPFQGPLRLVDEVTGDWTLVVLVALGVVLGLLLALSAHGDVARVSVSDHEVSLAQDGDEQRVARAEVACVFAENGRLVLQDDSGRRRAGVRLEDLDVASVEEAFTNHGYAWVERDPFEAQFSRWVPDGPGLPAGANAILTARQKALEAKNGEDSEDFRRELAKLDVVVRDEGTRQFWRPVN